ncbi:phasin family protein [Massilia soli]|uniref:Phasin family protein n=1 Tax=Massilia soli TaxID=2792854 RepID=A0ABS7SLL6_9BURK|nr:phasin family protein [Massilia soli]MBZ2207071.1 phasin family protein [Massilia soli]
MQPFANNPALRSHFDTQVNFFTELAQRSVDSARQLSELNLRLAQQLMEESISTSRQLLACSDPLQAGNVALRAMEPLARHLRQYQQQLVDLVSGAQVALTHTAETHIPEAGRSAAALADDMARRSLDAGAAFATMQRPSGDGGLWRGPNGSQQKPG